MTRKKVPTTRQKKKQLTKQRLTDDQINSYLRGWHAVGERIRSRSK